MPPLPTDDDSASTAVSASSNTQMPGYPSEQELEEAYRNVPISSRVGSIDNPKGEFDPEIPDILPHEQVFSIQVGEKLFKLSGASLSSDAPSYFTTFFLKHKDLPKHEWPTLYIDRSPKVFELIVSHLQGYYVIPENDVDFVYLLLDANYYHLPRLIRQLANAEIHIRIGDQSFSISRNIFNSPGNTPNFFTIGLSSFFGSEVAPKSFKRPPPVAPPTVPQRSGELFKDLLKVLQGSMLDIKDEKHRLLLLNECKFYRFFGLEQKLIAHSIQKNRMRNTEEIVIELNYIRPKQLKFQKLLDILVPASAKSYLLWKNANQDPSLLLGNISTSYKRPYIDTYDRELIIQLTSSDHTYYEPVGLCFTPAKSSVTGKSHWEAVFYDSASVKMKALINTLINGANRKLEKQVQSSQPGASSGEPQIKTEEQDVAITTFEDFEQPNDANNTYNSASGISNSPQSTSSVGNSQGSTVNSTFNPITVATGTRGGYFVCADDAFVMLNGKVLNMAYYSSAEAGSTQVAVASNDNQAANDGGSELRKKRRLDSVVETGAYDTNTTQPIPPRPVFKRPENLRPIQMVLVKSQWRVILTGNFFMLELLKAEGHCGQKYINSARSFV